MNPTKQTNNRFNTYKTFLIIFSIFIYGTTLLFFTANAEADNYYVKTLGNNVAAGTNWQSAWQTIGYAVSNVTSGDVIIVSNGSYNESITIANSTNISLISWSWLNSQDNTKIIMYGQGSGWPGFIIDNSKKIVIKGYTFNGQDMGMMKSIEFNNNSISNVIMNNIIYSNHDAGIGIDNTCSFNYIMSNKIFDQQGAGQRDGIFINGFNNIIENNEIYKNTNNTGIGISLTMTASNNIISKNTIYSNYTGIRIEGRNNTISYNQIYNNQSQGIWLWNNAENNYIIRNSIYSNVTTGINIDSNDTDDNYIMYNNIYGSNQLYGILIDDGDHNTIYSNKIHHNNWGGIRNWLGSASSNYFIKNSIYSNKFYGIYIRSDSALNNFILTNNVWGRNQDYGIYIQDGNNNKIYRNLIRNSVFYGIYLAGSANNIEIINNTIYKAFANDGIHWHDTSSGIILNNIILSNGNGAVGYGINRTSSGIIYAAYNNIYGNINGATNGGITWGSNNILLDPLIDTLSTFQIISSNSPAVDSATNIPGISDNYNGNGPDMGWKEYIPDTTPPVTTASKDSGFYAGEIEVVLTAVDNETPDNIIIYYTTDGSNPKTSSTVKNGISPVTIKINSTTTLKFYAKNTLGLEEKVQTRTYTFTKIPLENVAVYNNYLDLSTGESAHIIFGRAANAEIKIYNIRGILVMSWEKQYYNIGEGQFWNGTVKEISQKAGAGLYIVVVKGDINKKLKMIIKK